MFSWRVRRQIIAFLIAALPLAITVFWGASKLIPAPSCFDNQKNQGELGIDCGGPCEPCELKNPAGIKVFWARSVWVRDTLNAAALTENPNEFAGGEQVLYEFTFFDERGLVARRIGETFILPRERVHIIESGISASREPTRVEFRITSVKWRLPDSSSPSLVVKRRDYKTVEENGRRESLVEAEIENRSSLNLREVYVSFVVLGKDGNVLGLNKVLAENIVAGSSKTVRSIWPQEFTEEAATIEVEPRVNMFDPNVIFRNP